MSKYICPNCGHEHEHTGSETMRIVDGQVRRFDSDSGEAADMCPECGTLSDYQRRSGPIQVPGLSFIDSGTGKKVVK